MEPEYEDGGVPVFRPSYEEFKDFRKFVKLVESVGMQSGIIKVIPPQEWLSSLPKADQEHMTTAKVIRKPIAQVPIGRGGVYQIQNIERKRAYSLAQWLKMCSQLQNQPPAPRGFPQFVVGEARSVQDYNDSDFSKEKCQELSKAYWRTIGLGVGVAVALYGADVPGSLFADTTTEWNVANLDSILSQVSKKIPGVTESYLYCGMWRATFTWHVEDMDLPSINYIHFGAPKQWYAVPQSHHQQMYKAMAELFPEDFKKCPEFLRHKTFLVDPEVLVRDFNIPVNHIVHRQHEFIITFPHGYHSGFNYGYNCAESVNFGTESWLDIGVQSRKCLCVNHSVGIDMQSLIYEIYPERRPIVEKVKTSTPKPVKATKPIKEPKAKKLKAPKPPKPPKPPKAPKPPKVPRVKKVKEAKPKRKLKYTIDSTFWDSWNSIGTQTDKPMSGEIPVGATPNIPNIPSTLKIPSIPCMPNTPNVPKIPRLLLNKENDEVKGSRIIEETKEGNSDPKSELQTPKQSPNLNDEKDNYASNFIYMGVPLPPSLLHPVTSNI